VILKGPPVTSQEIKESSAINSSPLVLRGGNPVILKKAHQEKVKNLKSVPWNYSGSTTHFQKEEEVVADIKRTVGYQWSHEMKKQDRPSVEVSKEEIKEFLRKMKHPEAIIYDDLEEAPKKISMLDLILNSKEHREVLVKVLAEGFIDKEILSSRFEDLVRGMLANDKITFSDADIPREGMGHRKALHIAVQSEGYLIGGVLIDGGSAHRSSVRWSSDRWKKKTS
jgi:hypothetical protein